MLCVEDWLDALKWADGFGLSGLIAKSEANLAAVEEWVGRNDWVDFLAASPEIRSHTSVCLNVTAPKVAALPKADQEKFLKGLTGELAKKKIAYDINPYRDAPPGFRFWCGPTVEAGDIRTALTALEAVYREKVAGL